MGKTVNQALSTPFHPRYEIVKKLDEGGMATVYQVRDRKEYVIRALKVLKPSQLESKAAVEQFEDEFRILRHLHHPGLPEMYDYGVAGDGTRYMVMEYIEGEPLDQYCAAHEDELRLLLYQITEALTFIHEHNLLHLDLKPENIIVRRTTAYGKCEKPQIVLIDFGLSHRRDAGGDVGVSGTLAYIAPEILRRKGRLTRAVDYYSLGVTLYKLIEGRFPFEDVPEELIHGQLYNEVTFQKEMMEYADLYPHVRSLMSKDPRVRLEGFEVFRRMLSARVSEEIPPLKRAYGMGYIESVGMIGKQDEWKSLMDWVGGVSRALAERREEMLQDKQESVRDAMKVEKKRTVIEPYEDLLVEVRRKAVDTKTTAPEREKPKGSIKEHARTLLITGATSSGKSYFVDRYRGECLLRGMGVWVLGDGGEYETLVSEDAYATTSPRARSAQAVDPRALIIDRFVRGWERLEAKGKAGGSVLVVDGYKRANKEEREFLEYVGKRLDLAIDEGREPGVFIVVTSRSPRLKKELKAILPKKEKLEEHVIPPPGIKDIEAILDDFHGRMTGVEDRRRLGEYLRRNEESSGAIAEALRQALIRGDLVREEGRWRFVWMTQKARRKERAKENYFQMLYEDLGEKDQDVLNWLSCNKHSLRAEEFHEISGITEESLQATVERLKPYRILDVVKEKGEIFIGIVSSSAAEGLYGGMPVPERKRIHEKYLLYYGEKLAAVEKTKRTRGKRSIRKSVRVDSAIQRSMTAAEEAMLNQYADLCELMAFHYGQVGEIRPSLLMRVKALRAMKQVKDVFGMRRLCEEGINAVRKLRGKKWESRKWHIERYFIREWVEAEWMVENFRNVVEVVEGNIIRRKKELPLGVFFRYGMALRWLGDYKTCNKLLEVMGKQIKSLQGKVMSLLVEAAVMNNMNKYSRSISLLNKLVKYKHTLNEKMICSVYIYYTLNYYYMGEKDKYGYHLDLLKQYAQDNLLYDELLLAYYYEIDGYFNSARYQTAREVLKKSVKLANKLKKYHRLCLLYNLLSGVYYEEGLYEQAIKYVNKSIDLASNLGLVKWSAEGILRISFNLELMGLWRDSIAYAERIRNSSMKHSWKELHFYSLLQLFNLFTSIRIQRTHIYKDRCMKLVRETEMKRAEALFNYFLGNYFFSIKKIDDAIKAYNKSEKQYSKIGYKDDSIRSAIKIGNSYLEKGQYNLAKKCLLKIKERIKEMESNDIIGDYLILSLNYYYLTGKSRKKMINHAILCSKHLNSVKDINTFLRMSIILFRVYSRIGNKSKGIYYFQLYHKKMKMIIGQLGNPYYEECFIKGSDYMNIKKEAKLLMLERN